MEHFADLVATTSGRVELAGSGRGGALLLGFDGRRVERAAATALPLVLIGVGDRADPGAAVADVVVPDATSASAVLDAVARNPIAATALALLLRDAESRAIAAGLVAESSTYSTLQSGPEHASWLRSRRPPRKRPRPDEEPVEVRRQGDVLRVTLQRRASRNAVDTASRDALLDALAVASHDAAVNVVIDGAGPSFCSGGDLDEFGTLADPASAHLLRLGRSVGDAIHALADRVTVEVHGACVGAGVELPAFAGRVEATTDATFSLPEVSMGLVPGAGGTVSITRRIGRHRTAWLALTGDRLAASDALRWGLVDELRR